MEDENDAITGGEELTLDEAAARYVASTNAAVSNDQAEEGDPADSETTDDVGPHDPDNPDDEGETGIDDQAEESDEEPESEQGRFVADNAKVRLDDGRVVSISDLKQGSLLMPDYPRKTQELAEQRRSVESQSSALKQLETQLSQQRELVSRLLQSRMPQEPDISLTDPHSPNFDPIAYQHQRAQYEKGIRDLQQLYQQSQQAEQKKQAEYAEERAKKSEAEMAKLIEAVPAFKDQNRFNAFARDAKEYGEKFGFTTEELVEGIGYDHRMAKVLYQAILWEKLQASKPKAQSKVQGRPPVTTGGKRLSPDAQRARAKSVAMDRLKSSGSVDDAVRAYLAK